MFFHEKRRMILLIVFILLLVAMFVFTTKLSEKQKSINEPQTEVSSLSWHPKAKGQIVSWKFNYDRKIIEMTIIDRATEKTFKAFAKFKTSNGDRYFLSDSLPAGLQVVMPGDGIRNWVVNIDARKGFVEKIVSPDNIVNSPTDANANKDDYGGKTFETGEAFLILRQTPMTIRPPIY